MNVAKMPGNTQVKVQAAKNKTSATPSSGDDFIKLLQSKQNVSQSQKADSEGGMVQNKVQQDSTKGQEDRIEESNEDTSDNVLKEDISQEEILQQATLQQAAAQMVGIVTEIPQQTQEALTQIVEGAAPIESILTNQESQLELVTEQPIQSQLVAQPDSKPVETIHQQKENDGQKTELKDRNPAYQDNANEVKKTLQATEHVKTQSEQVQEKSQPESKVQIREANESQMQSKMQAEETIGSQANTSRDLESQQTIFSSKLETTTVESQTEAEIEPQIQDISQKQDTPQQQENGEGQGLLQEKESSSKAQNVQGLLNQEEKKIRIDQESGIQGTVYHSVNQPGEAQRISSGEETKIFHLKTAESELPQDLGKALATKLLGSRQTGNTLTVELEPASLGKLTIKLVYEAGRAAVSILASNPRTLEILNQRAAEIASILEEKTGQETVIYTQPSQQQENQDTEQRQGGRGNQQNQEERHQSQEGNRQHTESFAQQLRLGLI